MTKIKMLNDRIIFDGHADTRQECETITLMCDNLAKSKDFKTVRYESGYAEFEKVGKTEELKFRGNADVIINFDEHITKVTSNMNLSEPLPPPMPTTATWTTSGENVGVIFGSAYQVLNVILADGYVIDAVTGTETPISQDAQPITFSEITDNSFAFSLQDGADYTITITSKIPAAKQTIDVSTLAGWANLATGNHQITIKTKASGYADSAASNAVTVSKAASGYSVSVERYETHDEQSYEYSTDNGVTWNAITGEGLIVESATQIKFRVTGTAKSAEASISSLLLDMNIVFSSPGDAVGTWRYSENYILTQNIDDIVCIPYL